MRRHTQSDGDLLKEPQSSQSEIALSPVYKSKLFRFNRLNDVPQFR